MLDLVTGGARRPARTLVLVAAAAAVAGGCESEAAPSGTIEVIAAPPTGDVAAWVRERVAAAGDRQVIVDVGASWCAPCQRFHAAVAAGRLDGWFPRLTLLEFDQDRDEDRLTAAGYTSGLIPLFARPGADGRASGRAIEGSIHGVGAVVEIAPRLARLLAP